MNWVRNNRFLAAFLAVIIVVGGALTFLLITSYSHYDQVDNDYKTQVAELQRLQRLDVYPDEENLQKYEELRKNYVASVNDLQTKLAAYEPAPENPPPTPLQFQDRLRKVVEDSIHAAQTSSMELPKDYYMGFEQYRSAPPDAAATPLLSAELNDIDDLVGILIKANAEKLLAIRRGLLPQESSAATPSPNSNPGQPGNKPDAASSLVTKDPVEISFTALPSSFREILNQITNSKRLYIVRAVQIKNQKDKGPSRIPEVTPGAPGAPAPSAGPEQPAPSPSDPNAPPLPSNTPSALRYVVGQEKLDVTMRVELVKVQPLAGGPAKTR